MRSLGPLLVAVVVVGCPGSGPGADAPAGDTSPRADDPKSQPSPADARKKAPPRTHDTTMPSALDPDIVAAVADVNATRVMSRVTTLSSFTTRNTSSDDTPPRSAIGAPRPRAQARLHPLPAALTP